MPGLDRRLASIERRLAPRPVVMPADVPVVTIPQVLAMSPAERAIAYREMVRGRLTLETGADRAPPIDVSDPRNMTPAQRAAIYRPLRDA
jgi:hypothetical protein